MHLQRILLPNKSKGLEVRMKQIMEESKGEKKVKEGAIKYITEDEAEGNKQEGGRGGGNRGRK